MSRSFTVASEVRKGCDLLPLLFILYISNECKNASQGKESDIDELLFVDEQALIADTSDNHLRSLDQECKTDCMRICIEKADDIRREGHNLNISKYSNR